MSVSSKDNDQYEIGKKMISIALNMDEALTEILRLEVKNVKKALNTEYELESLNNLTKTLRHVIIALTLTEEKIKTGLILSSIKEN